MGKRIRNTRGRKPLDGYECRLYGAVLDGLIGLVREVIREQELVKEENVQINEETKGVIANGHFGTWHTAEMKEISGELFYRMEHEEYGDWVASIYRQSGRKTGGGRFGAWV